MEVPESGIALREKASPQQYLRAILDIARPAGRVQSTLPSVLTSADIKLAYDRDADRFRPFILGDVNANPEGITVHDAQAKADIPTLVAERFMSNIEESDASVVVLLPENVFDSVNGTWRNEDGWLTRDKKAVVAALEKLPCIDRIYRSANPSQLTVDGAELSYTSDDGTQHPVDGYVNLNDLGGALGAALEEDLEAISLGANAPTAVWNPHHPWTNKVGLLRKLSEVVVGMSAVAIPRFQEVRTVDEIATFLRAIESDAVLKGPYGTWGDEVVSIRAVDEIERRILEKERIVQHRREWPEFSMLDISSGTLQFRSRSGQIPPVKYGHVEEAIEERVVYSGHIHDIIEVPARVHPTDERCPIDFVPLVTRSQEAETVTEVRSILLRISGREMLNANANTEYLTFVSLEEALKGPVSVPTADGEFDFDLQAMLTDLTGRVVPAEELRRAIELAGAVAFTARNLSAYAAETELNEDTNPSFH